MRTPIELTRCSRILVTCGICLFASVVVAEEAEPSKEPSKDVAPEAAGPSVEDLVARAKNAIVEVSFTGRDGKRQGLGTGFVVDADGLIATNLHVIGEARPITVRFADGRSFPVTAIHATQPSMDLALLKIDAEGLPALELSDSSAVKTGRRIVVLGNPRGLRHSVVEGVVSAKREVDGKPMLQIAMPIEQGNSGGPVIDTEGRVLGVVTLKSLVTRNLGFAVEIDALKPLIEKPNPVPMKRWLTIGTLDARSWKPLFGADWRQRAGRVTVSGGGTGFGGRSLCVHQVDPPAVPFEVAVTVKLDDESGAAGLVLHSDGGQRHYGFYPSNGQLRFSRFDGPDVFNWNVLHQVRTPHYRSGEWNTLKLRVEAERVIAYVNGHRVVESTDRVYTTGKVGLAKFRQTKAEFKRFRLGREVPSDRPTPEVAAALDALVTDIDADRPPTEELVREVADRSDTADVHLRNRARLLERQAERLRQLARTSHLARLRKQLLVELSQPVAKVDPLRAALLLARMDNEDVDVEAYLAVANRMAEEVRESLPAGADDAKRLAALDEYLFEQNGFHGSRTNYYSRSNSYLNEVLDDREGLPITLSLLYAELARRLDVKVVGVGLPGHFVVRFEPSEGESELIDVFDRGRRLTREEAAKLVLTTSGLELADEHLVAVSAEAIIVRMVHNLMGLARRDEDAERMLECIETLVALEPESGTNRFFRAVLRFNTERHAAALVDTAWLLEHEPDDVDLARVRTLHQVLEQSLANDDAVN